MVKKLRYYARFIVVCLLLKKMKLVRDLVRVSCTTLNGSNKVPKEAKYWSNGVNRWVFLRIVVTAEG